MSGLGLNANSSCCTAGLKHTTPELTHFPIAKPDLLEGDWGNHKNMKEQVNYSNFSDLDIRVGRVVGVEDAKTTKPTYKISVDFGGEIGIKVSCGAYRNYEKDYLVGQQVVAVTNLGVKQMGPEVSEVLILGVKNDLGETIFLRPERDVQLGEEVF